MKIVYSDPKTGKTAQMEIDESKASAFMHHRINEVVDGAVLGLSGYKLKITGGSDRSGFAMNRSINGAIKTKVLERVSMTGKSKGQYRRHTVIGNTVSSEIELVNTVIIEYGDKPASELFPEKEKKEEKQ